jgi:hypothetical protein
MEEFKHVLFIDIETVPCQPNYSDLPEGLQKEWKRKAKFIKQENDANADPSMLFADKAGIFSEFAKVVCIGFGSLHKQENGWQIRLKSLTNDNEKVLLTDFCEMLERFANYHSDFRFCGHNIKEFDIPFLCRRIIINGIGLPPSMQLSARKPWEVSHLDTLELWRFGDYKHYTSLVLLAEVLGIPSPKDDIDGSMVAPVYWQEKNLPRIAKYCLQDVLTTAKVFLKLKGIQDTIEPVFVNDQI